MKATTTFEASVAIARATRPHVPEDSHLDTQPDVSATISSENPVK
jgi:hypothetical protein